MQIMKKSLLLSALFVSMLAVSCGGLRNTGPKETADKFVKTLFVEVNTDAARRYVAEDLLDEFPAAKDMSEIEKQFVKILKDHAKAYGYKFEYDESLSKIGEDAASVFYVLTAKGNPEWQGTGDVTLQKNAEGKWVVTDYGFDRDEDAIDFGF